LKERFLPAEQFPHFVRCPITYAIFKALRAIFGEPGLALLAVIGVAAAVTWIIYVFFSEGTRYSAQQYYDLKLKLSVEAAKTAAQIATSDQPNTLRAAAIRFDELYWGELVLVEDSKLEGAMVQFRQLIAPDNKELDFAKLVAGQIDRKELRSAALRVSRAGFNLLQPSWWDQLYATFRKPEKN
jgi:hypothetical protein